MTKTNTYAPLPTTRRANANTIYRDIPFVAPAKPFTRPPAEAVPDQRVSNGILLGLAALLLPTVAYSFAQMWSLVPGGSLEHAIRAFFP